jgi:hypothetical protein
VVRTLSTSASTMFADDMLRSTTVASRRYGSPSSSNSPPRAPEKGQRYNDCDWYSALKRKPCEQPA